MSSGSMTFTRTDLAGLVATLMPDASWAAGAILLLGCLAALLSSVARAARR